MSAPRTYEAGFALTDGRPTLMTAEEWLTEEAHVWATMSLHDDQPEEPNRAGTLLAIAREVKTLRRERSQWAESHTALVARVRELEATLAMPPRPAAVAEGDVARLREVLRDLVDGLDWWRVDERDREFPAEHLRDARAALATPAGDGQEARDA